jgi:hypothetical protein
VGSQWFNTTTNQLFEYTYDGLGYYWVDISSPTSTIYASNGSTYTLTTITSFGSNGNTVVSGNLTVNGNIYTTGVSSSSNISGITTFTSNNVADFLGNVGFSTTTPLATLDMSQRTDMMLLPVGTTTQRPSTAANGSIRFNTTVGAPEWYSGISSQWVPFYQSPTYNVSYLLVAGGGGGGNGGGGGGGGLLTGTQTVNTGLAYSIIVGSGSPAAIQSGVAYPSNTNGVNSTALGQTAIGGGSGGVTAVSYNTTTYQGANGGSGGGSGGNTAGSSQVVAGGTGTSGQGNAGGSCPGLGNSPAGGGGGAGAVGVNGSSGAGGAGGVGLSSSINNTATYYAGGGGGGGYSVTVGAGGSGGGSAGTNNGSTSTAATANTGGGGGGSGSTGGAGGSGIVIITYQNATQRGTGGVVTSFGSGASTTWVHTFTSSGTYTA